MAPRQVSGLSVTITCMKNCYDFLIIGGGVIGLSIARALKKEHPHKSICLIEKESTCGEHASGRNSGVLHAGFYYTADSLKARFTREGNVRMTDYCLSKKIPLNTCGKLVVAKDASELAGLDELYKRGLTNNVPLEMISEPAAREIEPRVKTYERALFSPTTSTVDPLAVIRSLEEDAKQEGVTIYKETAYLSKTSSGIMTTKGELQAGFIINAAGLYADKIALDFGFSQDYRILPFKGLYLYSNEPSGALRTNIYPVPDLKYPFLGVHFTITQSGKTKIGPTAIPAFWREQYDAYHNFNLKEFFSILKLDCGLLFSDKTFKKLAARELAKYAKKTMVRLADELLEGVLLKDYTTWGKPGIRAQLFDIKKKKLEMDFVVEGDQRSLHVLNAVSPAFTCAFSFADYVSKKIGTTPKEVGEYQIDVAMQLQDQKSHLLPH